MNLVKSVYSSIYQAEPDKPPKENMERLAAELSMIAHKTTPWSWRYIYSAYKGHSGFETLSDELTAALLIRGAMEDNQSELQARSQQFVGYSPHNLPDGIIVLGEAKQCPECLIQFVGRVWNQRYCTPSCRTAYRRNGK